MPNRLMLRVHVPFLLLGLGSAYPTTWDTLLDAPRDLHNESIVHRRDRDDSILPWLACGHYPPADMHHGDVNWQYLQGRTDTVTLVAGTCNRVATDESSAVYGCNDTPADVEVPYAVLGNWAADIQGYCGNTPDDLGGTMGNPSGQIFVSDQYGPYNVVVAYGNNDDPVDARPDSYPYPGPNGDPFKTCGLDVGPTCAWGACDYDTLVVTSVTSETCDGFLGPDYTVRGNTLQYSYTQSHTAGWTIGGFVPFNIGPIGKAVASAAPQFSYTDTTTSGYTTGVSAQCGEPDSGGTWTCGLEIQPKCLITVGSCHAKTQFSDLGIQPFTASLPQTQSIGGSDQSVFGEFLCLCPNCPGTTEAGAPGPLCSMDCATCLG